MVAGAVRAFLTLLAIAAAPISSGGDDTPPHSSVGPPSAATPHLVFLLADDMGWAQIGWHEPYVKTPQLDALAAAGITLDHY